MCNVFCIIHRIISGIGEGWVKDTILLCPDPTPSLTPCVTLGFELTVTILLPYKNKIIAFKFLPGCIHCKCTDSWK